MADALLPYRAMAYNNAWANHRLLTACAGLAEGEFRAPRTGFFPSLSLTLNHILLVDRFYIDAMEGGTLGHAAFVDPEPYRTVADLAREQAALDRRLIACVEERGEAGLLQTVAVHRGERIQHERFDRLLLHLVQHQIHHRGQVHAMLSGTSVAPPQLDEFYAAAEAPLRVEEFARLGFSERAIWS